MMRREYRQFRAYCATLTDAQVINVVHKEREGAQGERTMSMSLLYTCAIIVTPTSDQPTFRTCTEARYNEMLEVLPPLAWTRKGFLVSEPWSHRTCKVTGQYRPTYQAMVRCVGMLGGYCESTSGLTVPEWRALNPVTLQIESKP
jgi:hypothetical protein